MRKFVVPALAAICMAGAFAAPAAAAETFTVKVDYSDLDLTTEAARDVLEARIDAAIKTVCARPDTRNLKVAQAWQDCKESAASSAADQLEKTIEFASL